MPSIVLISVDDMRFDAIAAETDTRYLDRTGLAGMRNTPTLDALAGRGIRFSQAFTTCTYTPSAHASMFTGLYPPRHGVRAFMTNPLPSRVVTVASQLQSAGYGTVASIDMAPMFALLGLTRGFEHVVHLDDAAVFESVAKAASEKPVFLFAHFEDVHPPVRESLAPLSSDYNDDFYEELAVVCRAFGVDYDGAADRDAAVEASGRLRRLLEQRGLIGAVELPRYLGGVNKFDRGRLAFFLAELSKVLDPADTVVMLTSDHGQGVIPSHRMVDTSIPQKFDHGEAVPDELLRVPLVAAGPGIEPGTICDAPVSLVDVLPTILELAGTAPADAPLDGRSLVSAFGGSKIEPSAAYAEVWYHDRAELSAYLRASVAAGGLLPEGYRTFLHERAVRDNSLKLVVTDDPPGTTPATGTGGSEALFDVARDPYEEVDLLAQTVALEAIGGTGIDRGVLGRLRGELARVGASAPAEQAAEPADSRDMAEIEEHLRALGYVD